MALQFSGLIDDARLWDVLQQVGLFDYVRTLPEGLDAPIEEVRQDVHFPCLACINYLMIAR